MLHDGCIYYGVHVICIGVFESDKIMRAHIYFKSSIKMLLTIMNYEEAFGDKYWTIDY